MREAFREVIHAVIRPVIGPIIGRTPSGGGNPPPPPSAPTVIAPPVIEGDTEVGSILTLISPGVFAGNPSPTVTGAWFKDAVATGISTPTYTTAAAGSYEWRSTATNSEGSITAPSNAIAVVASTPGLVNIYTHNFGGSSAAPLGGVVVDVSSGLHGGALAPAWGAATSPANIKADGSFSNASPQSFLLPFVPQLGMIYSLSCRMDLTTIDAISNYPAFGFFVSQGEPSNVGQAWVNLYPVWGASTFSSASLNQFWFYPPLVGAAPPFGAKFTVELDTTTTLWTYKVYINDVLQYTFNYSVNPTIAFVGIYVNFTVVGKFDDFKLDSLPVPASLTPYETLILSRGPLCWYRNNAADGNYANDYSGKGNHGLYQATPDALLGDLDLPTPQPTAPVAGILYNQPGPGSDPVIEITSTTAGMRCLGVTIPASATAFTVECWFYPTNVAGNSNQTMSIGLASAAQTGLYAPFSDQQTYFRDGFDTADPAVGISSSGLLSPNNTWRHTVGVVDGNVMKLYVDGILVASSSIHVRPGINEAPFAMGYNYEYRTTAHTLGRYGDCMVYLHALSEAQIIENRNARLGITAGLIASHPEVIHDYKTPRVDAPGRSARRRKPPQ